MGPRASDAATGPDESPVQRPWQAGSALRARLAELPLLLDDLGGGLGEVGRFEHLADLDLAVLLVGLRASPHPLDGLLLRLHLDHPVAREELLRLGKRAVHHGALAARELDARSLRARLEASA